MPRKYVLDASVVARAFLPDRRWHKDAERILALLLAGDMAVLAPENARYEFCGLITKTFRKRRWSADQALAAVRAFERLPILYFDPREFVESAVRLAFTHGKGFYDMCYFAVGHQEGVPVCTADEKSVRSVGENFPCEFVLLVDFFGLP